MTELDKLAKVIAERAPGPWLPWVVTSGTQETPAGRHIPLVHGAAPPHEITGSSRKKALTWTRKATADAVFIATMGTVAEELLAVVQAAEHAIEIDYFAGGGSTEGMMRDAFAALKAKLAAMPE